MPCFVVTAAAEAAVLSTCVLLIYMHVHVSEVAELFATVCCNSKPTCLPYPLAWIFVVSLKQQTCQEDFINYDGMYSSIFTRTFEIQF